MRALLVAAVAFCLAAATGRADDWPQFRGPTGQGIAPEGRWPVVWGPNRNVAWKRPIPGRGWSSPVVWRGRVYLTTAVPLKGSPAPDQSLRALCLDAATGNALWSTEVFRPSGATSPPIHPKNSHASPTPVTDGRRLYVHFGHNGTAALALDGKVLWRQTGLRYQPVHGSGGSPILAGRALIFSCDGADQQFLAALDREDGKVLWKTPRRTEAFKKFSFSTPLLIPAGSPQVISAGSDVVGAYDPATGRELWRVRYHGYSIVTRPVFACDLVFVGTGYESPTLLAIRPGGEGDVTQTHVVWKGRRAMPLNPSPLAAGDDLYLVSDDGVASCLDARTGKVHWRERLGGSYSASPLLASGQVYCQDEDGTAVVLRAAHKFEVLARNALGERTLASYAAADGAFFIRTESHLYRIAARGD